MKASVGKIFSLVASDRLTVWLVAAWTLLYVTLAVWSAEAFTAFIHLLAASFVFKAVYIVFLANITVRLIAYLRVSLRVRPLMAAANGLFVGGFILILLGFFLSVATKQMAQPLAGEGSAVVTPWDGKAYGIERVAPSLRDSVLDIDDGDGLFSLEPKVTIATDDGAVEIGAFPPVNVGGYLGGAWMHVLQCGLAPVIRVSGADGNVMREGRVALRLLPPGGSDRFSLDGTPYSFVFKLSPSRVIKKGNTEGRVYDIVRPVYEITVVKGGEELARELSNRPIVFDGLALEITGTSSWAILDIARDPGIAFVVAGLAMLAAGGVVLPLAVARVFSMLTRHRAGEYNS
ncbi:MAG: hypothetical protein HZA20_01410 [Nitrospirae bacterium]|nr:hypothetical protein [Nitrospirota bacterium]